MACNKRKIQINNIDNEFQNRLFQNPENRIFGKEHKFHFVAHYASITASMAKRSKTQRLNAQTHTSMPIGSSSSSSSSSGE